VYGELSTKKGCRDEDEEVEKWVIRRNMKGRSQLKIREESQDHRLSLALISYEMDQKIHFQASTPSGSIDIFQNLALDYITRIHHADQCRKLEDSAKKLVTGDGTCIGGSESRGVRLPNDDIWYQILILSQSARQHDNFLENRLEQHIEQYESAMLLGVQSTCHVRCDQVALYRMRLDL
jgi:hypothetical protein